MHGDIALVEQAHCDAPLLDRTALHARAAVDFALAPESQSQSKSQDAP